MRRLLYCIIGLSVLFISCSGQTEYTIIIDTLLTLSEDDLSRSIVIGGESSTSLYILPGIFIDSEDTGPPDNIKTGMEVSVPMPSPPDPVRLKIELDGLIDIKNVDENKTLQSVKIEMFCAESDTENIYENGEVLYSESKTGLPPGKRWSFSVKIKLQPGDKHYDVIKHGEFSVGLKITIMNQAMDAIKTNYHLKNMDLALSGYPFGFL